MSLSVDEQTDVLYQKGVYLSKIKTEGATSLLFEFNSFYVEIIYANYRRDVGEIRSFIETDNLDPYLPKLELMELINH